MITYECMLEHGYPTVDPPSEDTFASEGASLWNPYGALPTPGLLIASPEMASSGQLYQLEIQETCPARAEDLLYDYEREHDGARPAPVGDSP